METAARAPAQTFRDLIVWQKAHQFVLDAYKLSQSFPREEMYGLTSQFRRAAISIAANIAEGFKKRGQQDKSKILEHRAGFARRVPVLFDSDCRSCLCRYDTVKQST